MKNKRNISTAKILLEQKVESNGLPHTFHRTNHIELAWGYVKKIFDEAAVYSTKSL